jgi:hypothetical protein
MFGRKKLEDEISQLKAAVNQLTKPDQSLEHKIDVQHLDYGMIRQFIAEAQNVGNVYVKFVDGTVIQIEGYKPQIGFKVPKDYGYHD